MQLRYSMGTLFHRRRQVFSLRSPITKAMICLVLRHMTVQSQRLWPFWVQNSRLRHIPEHHLAGLATKYLWVLASFSHGLRSILKGFGDERQRPVTDLVSLLAPDKPWEWLVFAFFCLSFRLQHATRTTVLAVILRLFQTVCANFDNVSASTYSTGVGFLDHTAYLTITYFSSTTQASIYKYWNWLC